MQSAQKSTESVTKAISESTKVTPIFKNRMAQLSSELENTNAKLELQRAKLAELKSEGSGVNEASIAQMQKLEQESMELEGQIRTLTDRISELKEKQKGAMDDFHAGMIGEEIKQVESSLEGLIAKADETGFKMADLQEKMDAGGGRRLQEQIVNTEATILRLQKSADKTAASIAKMESTMDNTGEAIEQTRQEMNKVSKSVNNMGNQFTKAFKRIAKQVLVFAVIYKGIREMQKFMNASLKTNQDFVSALNNLRANLLIAFQPIYDHIVPALVTLVQWLARAMQYVAAFISGLFGRTYSESMKAAQGLQTARKAMDAYGKSAKKANSVAGFDELNLIGGETDAGGAGAAGGGVDFGAIADEQDIGMLDRISGAMAAVSAKAKEMADRVKSSYGDLSAFMQQHSDLIIAALVGVGTALGVAFGVAKWGTIVATVQRAGAVIGAIIAGISWPITLAIAAVAGLTAAFTYFYRTNEGFRGFVQGILAGIGNIATWLWQTIMVPFGEWMASVFVASLNGVGIAAEWVWQNVFVPFGSYLKELWDTVLLPLAGILTDVLAIAFQLVSDIAKEFWQKVLTPLGKALSEMLAPAVEALSAVLTFLWQQVLKPLGTYLGGVFKKLLQGLTNDLTFLWQKVLKPLTAFVGGALRSVFTNTFEGLGTLINGLKNIFIGLMNFITGVFTADWRRAWEGVKQIFKGVFDSLWGIVRTPLNLIIDGVNMLIGGLNKINIDVPSWVGKIPGIPDDISSFGFNLPKIPKLDVGTNYVARDGLAFLHQGEAVVPKQYNPAAGGTGFDREALTVLRDILQALRDGRIAEVFISENDVTKTAIKGINRETRRTGRNPLTL